MARSGISDKTRQLAKSLRLNQTASEKALWRVLRELKAEGVHVRRQAAIGNYVADFAMLSRRIIIEIDGDVHGSAEQQAHDAERDEWFRSQGFRVFRYSSMDVQENLEGVVLNIRGKLGLD